jgi:hypothetical protein
LPTSTIQEVASYLREIKLILQGSPSNDARFIIATVRGKNIETLSILEYDTEDVKNSILSLSSTDYSSGPTKDNAIKGDLWVFGKIIKGREVYIKLKIQGDNRYKQVSVLSFHFSEQRLQYPLI